MTVALCLVAGARLADAQTATCGDVSGDGTNAAATDADCGAGYIADQQSVAQCAGAACDFSQAADRAACCIFLATCGDEDGAGASTQSVSDSDCGAGFVARPGSAATACAGAVCDLLGNALDAQACW